MASNTPPHLRNAAIWAVFLAVIAAPIVAAGMSPLLAWRDPIYIVAGFAGVIALALLLVQPVLVLGLLPQMPALRARKWHRYIGGGLVAAVVVHVAGLWVTSPPDVVDVLLFRSPTPFAVWGALAMWAVFATALLAGLRRRLRLRPRLWRLLHLGLAVAIVLGSVLHGLLIDGTMELVTKAGLCALVVLALAKVLKG